ncbi:MAG: class F sortase, partial [Chloroflexota bacterium]|nr:class F sortase [Chloroflexota bacterium]
LVTHRTRRVASHSVGEDLVSSRPFPEDSMTHTLTRRKLAALLTLPLGGTALVRSGLLAQADQVIEPRDGTPSGGTPTSLCLPATPGAGGDADACPRGPVPVTLVIAAIGVEAPVEILETVGGVMQQPRDETHVAWYKESARLGEVGNLWVAGHLNWWGVPEAVFFNLGTLRAGDTVVLHDEAETAYTYEVEWVRQESNLDPPAEAVLGMTAYEAVTLMTCGGQWDSTISEYDERTVARAKRVAVEGTPEA